MGIAVNNFQLVEAPAVVPLPYGLFSVAQPRLTDDPHWRWGVEFQSQACLTDGLTAGPCIQPDERDDLTPTECPPVQQVEPFTVYSYNTDPVVGYTLEERLEQTRQRLINGEQYAAERHFWQTMVSDLGPAISMTGDSAGRILGYLEQILTEQYMGTGVLHMNRQTATFLWEYLEVRGGTLVTKLGTPVVVGAGYDTGRASTDNDYTIFGTGGLVIYRGDIDTRETAVNRANNTVSYLAQRDYVVAYDCALVAVEGSYDPVLS